MKSRFVTDDEGKTGIVTQNDISILLLLSRYPYLPSTYIIKFMGKPEYTRHRLTILRHVLKVIYPPKQSWAAANARYRPAVYALTEKGKDELRKRGLYVEREHHLTNFAHDLMASLIMASIEIGADENGIKLFDWSSLKKHAKGDYRLSVSFEHAGETHTRKVDPDWSPFALKSNSAFYFLGIEADRQNEPIERELMEQSSIVRKFRAYREITSKGLFKQLGFENCFFLFATVNKKHEEKMRQALLKLTNGRGARDTLFMTLPDFTSMESFPKPTGWALKPWRRAGFPDFDILGELNGRNQTRTDTGAGDGARQN